MRKSWLIYLLPTLVASLSLTGCSKILSLFNKNIDIVQLNAAKVSYTYNDLQNHNIDVLDATPNTGSSKLLVVPVWFTDSSTYIKSDAKARVRSDIESAYFGSGSETGWQSVKTYYQALSQNRLNLTGIVSDWYECGQSSQAFYSEGSGAVETMKLVDNAVEWYKSTYSDLSMSSFDTDHNGYLDGVILIYGAPDYSCLRNEGASNLWAYCYWLQGESGTADKPKPNAYFWASYDFLYGKENGVGDYRGGDTSFCKLDTHTFIHEMGHMLGLDDYYDYSNKFTPAGGFSMQDANVGSHDPYSVLALGWANPYIPTETCALSIKPFQTNHEMVILSNNPKDPFSPFSEYFVVEFYSPTGLNTFDCAHKYSGAYPQGPDKYGIRLWHVDACLLQSTVKGSFVNLEMSEKIDKDKYYAHAMSNTYYSSDVKDYISPLGQDYANFNILQLIRNNKNMTYKPSRYFSEKDLFYKGDSFEMDTYKYQFVHNGKLNSGDDFRWSFKVQSISLEEAVITFTKK